MNKALAVVGIVVGLLVVALFLSFLFAWPVMLLWNYAVVGTIAGVAPLTFWKSWCLMVLCAFLFKSTAGSSSKS